MQRSTTLAAMILLLVGMAQTATAEKPVPEPKKLAITVLNNGFQPVSGSKIDEEVLALMGAERATDTGLVGLLKLDRCMRPLGEDCLLAAFAENRNEIAAALTSRGTDAWVLVVRIGSSPYDGLIWTITAQNTGGSRYLSYRHPGVEFESKGWLELAARAGLCAGEGPCAAR